MSDTNEVTEVYPEDRELIEKLAKLQNMYQQVSDLRGLLPERLLSPTWMALENPRGTSPAKLASGLKQAASEGSRDIQRFKKDFQSPEMRDLWQKTSTAEFGQGQDSWTMDYQALVKGADVESTVVETQTAGDAPSNPSTAEDVEAVVKSYEEPGSNLKILRSNSSSIYPLDVNVDRMSFAIVQKDVKEGKELLLEQRSESQITDLSSTIMQHINNRANRSSLGLLLGMLASYHDLKFKPCDKCQNVFNDQMQYPLFRRRKNAVDKIEANKTEWEILHSTCTN